MCMESYQWSARIWVRFLVACPVKWRAWLILVIYTVYQVCRIVYDLANRGIPSFFTGFVLFSSIPMFLHQEPMLRQRKVCPNVGPKVMVRKKFQRFPEHYHHPQWGHGGTKNQRLKKNSVESIRVSGDKFTKRLIMCCLYAPFHPITHPQKFKI